MGRTILHKYWSFKHSTAFFYQFVVAVIACLGLLSLAACQPQTTPLPTVSQPFETMPAISTATADLATFTPITPLTSTGTPATSENTPSPAGELTSSPVPTAFPAGFWQDLPVIPESISDRAREIYRKGIAMGNNPHIFTKLGDCNSKSPDFLHGFGGMYDLGEFAYLQPAIDYWQDSFRLPNQATNPGTTTSRLLVTLWTNDQCQSDEIMLDCQYRLDNPGIVLIALGTIDAKYHHLDPLAFEKNLRVIIESSIERGILPVLGTKADNIEGDHSINETIARLAIEYELPLWNYWKAVQPAVNHGLLPDMEHLNSWSGPPATDFSLPIAMDYGKEIKNITALQMLNFLMEQLADPSLTVTPTEAP